MSKRIRTLFILSCVLFALTLFAAVGGLVLPDLYQNSDLFNEIWRSNDLATLLLALPLFAGAVIWHLVTKSLKALLVWYGVLWYLCYNYAYYVFGATFNAFYLVHLFIYTLAIAGLILGLTTFPIAAVETSVKPKLRRLPVIGQMAFVSLGLTAIYVMQSLAFVFSGTLPAIIVLSGHVTSIVFTLDISMVVLPFVLASVLLAKKHPWGYVIAFLANLKGVLYMAVLTFASMRSNPSETGLWAALGSLSLAALVILWIGLKDGRTATNA